VKRRPFARGKGRGSRRVPGQMNGWESDWAARLQTQLAAGEIVAYWFEAVTFKLADDTRYTPDFVVMLPTGELVIHEIKGPIMQDDAWVKLKVFAELFPFRTTLARKMRKHGEWEIKEVGPKE